MNNKTKSLPIKFLLSLAFLLLLISHACYNRVEAKIKLKNFQLSSSAQINPWNHSLVLYSNRILLKSEVCHSKLTLSLRSKKKGSKKLKASFSSLSKNGKRITYRLNSASRAYLCPGNGTKNGVYQIRSSLFSKSLKIRYRERLTPNTLTGFVLTQKGKAISSAAVSLFDANNKKIKTVTTDQSGHYSFASISKVNLSVVVQKKGYAASRISSLSPRGKTLCQNIILPPTTEKNLALSCLVQNPQKQPIPSASLVLKDSSNRTVFRGTANASGNISIGNSKSPASNGFSTISCNSDTTHASFQKNSFRPVNLHILSKQNVLKRKETYSLYVSSAQTTNGVTKYQGECFHFSFSSFPSDQIAFQINLQPQPALSSSKASASTDMRILLYGNFSVTAKSSPLTFRLYQKNTSSWFFLKEVSSSALIPISGNTCKAFLDLNDLSTNTNYCLISTDPNFYIVKGNYFSTKTGTAVSSAVPSHQIICHQNSANQSTSSSALIPALTFFCHHQVDRSFLQKSNIYLNTVNSFYRTKGKKRFFDRYTSGAVLRTSQPSYRLTPFFVT